MADKPSQGLADVIAASTAVRGNGGQAGLPRGRGRAGERGLTQAPLGWR